MYIYILHDGCLVIYFSKRSQIDSVNVVRVRVKVVTVTGVSHKVAGWSRFNFSSGAPVCLVRFGEENGEIIDVYVKFIND